MGSILNQIETKIYAKIGKAMDQSLTYANVKFPIYLNIVNKIQPMVWDQAVGHTSRTVQINYDKTTTIRNYKTTNT